MTTLIFRCFTRSWLLWLWLGTASFAQATEPLRIVTSFYPMLVATANIARDIPDVTVVNLTPAATGCLHDYQLRPNELKALSGANVLVINGGGMESFVEKARKQVANLTVVDASRGIPLIADDAGSDAAPPEAGNDNPHVWVSISAHMSQIRNIADALAAADPPRADRYRQNAGRYLQRLDLLRDKMRKELHPFRGFEIVTFHEAFPYFAKEFNLRIAAVIQREPGSQPGARELASTIKLIRSHPVKALFAEPQYPVLAAQIIGRETGLRVWELDPVATGPSSVPEVYDAYLAAMKKNLGILREALR